MKINKGNLTKIELGSLGVDAQLLVVNCTYILLTIPAGRREPLLPTQQQPSQLESVTTQSMRSCYTSNFHFLQKTFFFNNNLPNFPLSSIKENSSPLFCRLAYGFYHRLLVPDCNFLLFLTKHILAGKITGNFIFKFSTI